MAIIHDILKKHWGYNQFRPLQEDIINSVLLGKDTLALMPTGGGKSICYQVPAMAREGLCLVISPLIALMKDQVENLRKKNITAYAIYSGMSRKEVKNVLKVASESNCKFLYVSPERLETALFKEWLPGLAITLVAVDEAHCISQWGYDFRPPYLRIANLRNEIPDVPILALTASATPDVQKDICDKLSSQQVAPRLAKSSPASDWVVFSQSFERPNLSYSVFRIDSRINKIIDILTNVEGTAIVYCKSRRRTREISELLQLRQISADYYHAGLTQEERNTRQEAWIAGKTRVIVCTNAFGMGIDKPDVRVVIHANVPDCLENYYQEAGRAGRDGKRAYAVLLYDEKELGELDKMSSVRFPPITDIRQVYQSVANYLGLHSGDGEGQYFDFDISEFGKKFKHSNQTALYALKALEQDGWLAFNEQVFLPSFVNFHTTKEYLYQFERSHPVHNDLIKFLLRSYEGIFDHPTGISENLIASLMRTDPGQIKKQLAELHSHGIIVYQPQKDTPQLFFLRSRIPAKELSIDMTAYLKRKERFEARVKKMLQYIRETAACRSYIIGEYFGDAQVPACGICDNCLREKAVTLTKEEFDSLNNRIISLVKINGLHTNDLLLKLSGIKKEKAWKVLEFLQAEDMLDVDPTGWITLKSHHQC